MHPEIIPHMQQMMFFDPLRFSIEIVYTLVIILLFLLIFYKTKSFYEITKYTGIKYFRIAFLLFAGAYAVRLLFNLLRLFIISTEYHIPGRIISFVSLLVLTYLSTLAIGYLIYSTLWKHIHYRSFQLIVHALALFTISIFYLKYPIIYFIAIQIGLIIILITINIKKPTQILYPLISLFWIFNLIIFHSRRLLSFEVKLAFQIISIALLLYLLYRVSKWTK